MLYCINCLDYSLYFVMYIKVCILRFWYFGSFIYV